MTCSLRSFKCFPGLKLQLWCLWVETLLNAIKLWMTSLRICLPLDYAAEEGAEERGSAGRETGAHVSGEENLRRSCWLNWFILTYVMPSRRVTVWFSSNVQISSCRLWHQTLACDKRQIRIWSRVTKVDTLNRTHCWWCGRLNMVFSFPSHKAPFLSSSIQFTHPNYADSISTVSLSVCFSYIHSILNVFAQIICRFQSVASRQNLHPFYLHMKQPHHHLWVRLTLFQRKCQSMDQV